MCRRYSRRQEDYLLKLDVLYGNDPKVNLCPKPMTDADFRKFITDYLLGEDWYITMPVSQEQVNAYIADAIINKFNVKRK